MGWYIYDRKVDTDLDLDLLSPYEKYTLAEDSRLNHGRYAHIQIDTVLHEISADLEEVRDRGVVFHGDN